jgi:hypothetical protein
VLRYKIAQPLASAHYLPISINDDCRNHRYWFVRG